MSNKWPLQKDCAKFYGNPAGANGKASAKWESENLVLVSCPWVLRYNNKPVKGIRVHRKCADSLSRVLNRIWERCGRSQAEIDRIGMSIYGGGYNFRAMRGGSSLSMHSYGCAVDFDPARNGLGNAKPAMDRRVIEEFEREGWEWGGHWSRPDGMHFQAAWTKANPPRLKASASSTASSAKAKAAATPFPPGVYDEACERLQTLLKGLGYHDVGMIDGKWGPRTEGALLVFKADNGLPLNTTVDAKVWAALETAAPRPVSPERAAAKTAPSEAAKVAQVTKAVGVTVAAAGATDTALQPVGGLTGALEWLGQFSGALQSVVGPLKDLIGMAAGNWPILVLLLGVVLYFVGKRVFRDELESFRRGEWS
jgi:Putative peptidoglycan-binding domain-containing protein